MESYSLSLDTLSSPYLQFNQQLSTFQNKVVLQRVCPSLWIEAFIEFRVEVHDEQGYNCPQFEHREGLACTVCWAHRKRYESTTVQHKFLRIDSLQNPSIWPEVIRARKEIPGITVQYVRGYLNLGTLFDVARRRMRYMNYKAWPDALSAYQFAFGTPRGCTL